MALSYTYSHLVTPYNYNPVSAPIWIVDYTTANQVQGFNYVYNVFSYDRILGTTYSLGQYKVPPRPSGQGVFDLHKILKSSVSNDYGFTMSYIMSSTSSITPIIDESCLVKFNYNWGFQESTIGLDTFGGPFDYPQINVFGPTGPTATPMLNILLDYGTIGVFQTGDLINIQMDGSSSYQEYSGLSLITNTFTYSYVGQVLTSVALNIPYDGGTINDIGYITTLERIIGTSSTFYGINGTRQYYNPNLNSSNNPSGLTNIYSSQNFIAIPGNTSATQSNFLTNYNSPDTNHYKSIFLGQYETIQLLSMTASYNLIVNTYDGNLNLINSYTLPSYINSQNYILYSIGIGTANLQGLEGIDLSTATYYTVTYNIPGSFSNTTIARRKIITNYSPYPNMRLMFLNQLGGFDYYNFSYDSKITTSITRTEFNKTLDYNYQIGDRGRSVLTIGAESQVIINSDYISQYDYSYLQELITSPNVYLIDEVNMLKIPVIIVDTAWEQKTILRDKQFVLQLTFKFAYPINLQSY